MKRHIARPFAFLFAALFMIACSGSPERTETQTIIPTYQTGTEYADLDTPEALAWGPPGIFSVKEGYAIPDNVRGVITILDPSYSVIREIDVRENAIGIAAVAQNGEDLLALDAASLTSKILRIGSDGQITTFDITVSSETPPSGLTADEEGVVLEYGGGENLYRITDEGDALGFDAVSGYAWNSMTYSVDQPDAVYTHTRTLRFGSTSTKIEVADHLGSAQVIGSDGEGGVYVLVEDVKTDPVVIVDQSVMRVASSGEIRSMARVPLEQRLVALWHGVTLDQTNRPVVLVPKREGLQFITPSFRERSILAAVKLNPLPNEIQQTRNSSSSSGGESVGTTTESLIALPSPSCLTPAQMQSNAQEYLNNAKTLTATNINSDVNCGGSSRYIPSYLGGPGSYTSVSYNWNGFDSPTQFDDFMTAGKKAGNWNTIDYTACAKGVDCSGFVSRVWGFTYKLGTTTIPSHVKPYTPTLALGDVLNKSGDHVVVFVSNATNGINTYESTHYLNYDRVVYIYRPWSTLTDYKAYRSETNCTP